jgi:DNA polymerase-3 subunit beta
MKAIYDREGLLAAFQLVSSVVPTKSPKTVLTNVKLVATPEKSVLIATDLEVVGIRYEVRGVKTEEPGEALLPTARLISILRESTDQELTLEADANASTIRGQYSEFELPGEDPAHYPDVPTFEGEKYHQIQSSILKEMISRTAFAAASESPRYALTGVLWELTAEKTRLVATDGRRLAVSDGVGIQHGKHSTEGQTPVVPTKAMHLLERNLSDPEEQVLVDIRPNDVLLQTNRAMIYGRLVEGRYPPYREVFPKKVSSKIRLPVPQFLSAVKQAAILTDEDSRGVDFSFAKGRLTLKAHVADKGRAKVEMPLEFDGKGVNITFDPRYVVDMLRVLDEDTELTLELADGSTAALFKAGDNYSYIVMPLTRENRPASDDGARP